jgi:hypothetical protein
MSTPDQDRATVLSRLRAALGVKGADDLRDAAVADRLKCHPRGTIPARASQSPEARIAFLEEMLTTQGAEVTRAKTPEAAVRAIADTLRGHDLPPLLRMGNDPLLSHLPWEAAPELDRRFGPAEAQDRSALSRAVAAAAEGPITAMVPASILQLHQRAIVLLDEEAASELKKTDYYRWVYDHKPDWQKY